MSDVRLYVAIYADADFRGKVIPQIQIQGYDVIYAPELGHGKWNDEEHLVYAATNNRSLLTHNARDFEPLYRAWWEAGRKHAGIIVSPQWETGEIVRRLLKLLNTVTADEMVNNYKHLGEFA
jgi:hypothetical protein